MNNYQHQGPLPPFISPFDDDPLGPNPDADYSYLSDDPVNSRYDEGTGIYEFNEPTVADDEPMQVQQGAPGSGIDYEFGAPYVEEPQAQQPLGLRGRTQAPSLPTPGPMQQSPAVLFRAPIPPAQQSPQRQELDINVHPRYRFPIVGELYDMVFGERGDRATRLGLKGQKRFGAEPSGDPLAAPQQYDTSRRVPFNSVVSPSVNRR